MITINRERRVTHSMAAVWALLAEPTNLPRVMPRIGRVELGATTAAGTPLTAHFNLGSQLGQRAAPGMFRAVGGNDISYECKKPLPILARWLLQAVDGGTLIKATLQFDLKPLLGPLAMMAPTALIKKNVGDELETALARADTLLTTQKSETRNRNE